MNHIPRKFTHAADSPDLSGLAAAMDSVTLRHQQRPGLNLAGEQYRAALR
jgi:hypothetical protein